MLYIAVYFYAIHSTDPDTATVLCNVSQCESVFVHYDIDEAVVGYVIPCFSPHVRFVHG